MRALVSGGAGFIGSHIVDALLARGVEVTILDNFQPRVHPKGRPPYLPPQARVVEGSVTDRRAWEQALDGVSVIFHEAAYQDYMPDFSTFLSVNAAGTALLYELIVERRQEIERVIVASSQAVYGEGQYRCEEHGLFQPPARPRAQLDRGCWDVLCPLCGAAASDEPLDEDYHNPFNAYAVSKLAEELTALRLGALHGIPTVALRYSITQGPRQSLYNSYSGICRIFCLRLLNGKPPVAFEDGRQKRDYVHVDDVVAANLLVWKSREACGRAFNVGGGRAVTVVDYAKAVAEALGVGIDPAIPGEYRLGDNRHSVSSIERLKALGWEPKKSVGDILRDYIEWVRSQGDVGEYFVEADRAMRELGVVRRSATAR